MTTDAELPPADPSALREAIADDLIAQSESMHETHNIPFRQGILWASLHIREGVA